MKYFTVAVLLGLVACIVEAQPGTCGGDCVQSDTCSIEAQDFNCRCSFFHCRVIPEGDCGGGCINDSQCSQWAAGDENCVCGPLFECVSKAELRDPGYQIFAKFIAASKKDALQQKVDRLMEKQKAQ